MTTSSHTSLTRAPTHPAIADRDPKAGCPMVQFVGLVSGKWAIPILYRLILTGRPVRFSDLRRAVAPITQKELTRQLRLFELRGLVQRQIYAEVPPRVEYTVTPLGTSLKPTLDSLAQWMNQHGGQLAKTAADSALE